MTKEQKKKIDYITMGIFYVLFSPIVIVYVITYGINKGLGWIFDQALNPLCRKICILVRKPIPNSTVQVKGSEDAYFKRVNEKLLTIKEAKELGKQYEEKGYEVHLNLSEF